MVFKQEVVNHGTKQFFYVGLKNLAQKQSC
jgi:hypothetical protein